MMFRKLLLAFTLLCLVGTAHAGDKPLYQPAPAWVTPAPAIDAAKLSDADPILLMIDQQHRMEDGQVWAFFDSATRIASPQVLTQAGTLPIPWEPSKGDLIVHAVEILRGAERIDVIGTGARFNVIQREQQLEQAALNGMLTATLALEGLRVGDVLHVSFSITRKDPALNGNVQTIAPILSEPMRLQFGRVRILWPKRLDLKLRSYSKGAEMTPVDIAGGYREALLTLPVAKFAEIPDDAPQRFKPLPLVEASSYADWTAVSKDMAPLYRWQGTIAPGTPLAQEVARIAAATTDARTRVAMALRLVQDEVRYLFRGMDGGNYVPQSPAQTWSLRYGDCKAKSLLLVALLRELGVEAEAVLVSADAGDLVPVRLPMPGAFNHVIVRAVTGGKELWLDGTSGGARIADLDDVPPFRHALPLREGGAALIAMPLRPDARPAVFADIEVDGSGGLTLPMPYKARLTVRGQQADLLRLISAQAGKEQLDAMIDGMLDGYLGNHQAADLAAKFDGDDGTAVLTGNGILYANWAKDNGTYKVQLDTSVSGIDFTPNRGRAAWKEIPVGSGVDDRYVRTRIRLPRGGAGFTLEGDQILPPMLGTAAVKRSVLLSDGWITLDDRITSGMREVAPADIPAARAEVARAKTRLLKAVAPADYPSEYWEINEAKKAKAMDPILAVYAKGIAEKPDDAERYTNRAWFLEKIYEYEAAVADLDKALELAPGADTLLWRARLHEELSDDDLALADINAALEIEPGSAAAIRQLAELKASTGSREEALALIEERASDGGQERSGYLMLQAQLLSEDGRTDEAITLLDEAIASQPGNPALLNSRCWLKGTRNVSLDTALKDCTKSIELSENPAAALDSRAMVYFRMGRFEDALADLDGALDHEPGQSASLFLRGIVRKRMGDKRGDEDLAAARTMAPRVDEDYAEYGIKP